MHLCSLEEEFVFGVAVLNYGVTPVATSLLCFASPALTLAGPWAFLRGCKLDAFDNVDVRVAREPRGRPGVTRYVFEQRVEHQRRYLKRDVDEPLAASRVIGVAVVMAVRCVAVAADPDGERMGKAVVVRSVCGPPFIRVLIRVEVQGEKSG